MTFAGTDAIENIPRNANNEVNVTCSAVYSAEIFSSVRFAILSLQLKEYILLPTTDSCVIPTVSTAPVATVRRRQDDGHADVFIHYLAIDDSTRLLAIDRIASRRILSWKTSASSLPFFGATRESGSWQLPIHTVPRGIALVPSILVV